MILFVFEGKEREPNLYKTLERLYFPRKNDHILCSFHNNIYELYNEMQELDGDGDIVSVMKNSLQKRGDTTLSDMNSADFSEIYLFFDYDFHNSQLPFEEINRRVTEMLTIFNEETENGKLYINYPMIESIRYVKELPDDDFIKYTVTREECKDFKHLSKTFSYYDSLDFIMFQDGEKPSKDKYLKIKNNWTYLKKMNVSKANFIITGRNEMPKDKNTINQYELFKAQKVQYVDVDARIAVLNSFPIFIYEYFR